MTSIEEMRCIYESLFDQCSAQMEKGKAAPCEREKFMSEFDPPQIFCGNEPQAAELAENALIRLVGKIRFELKKTAYGAVKMLCAAGASAEETSILIFKAEMLKKNKGGDRHG